MSAHRPSLPWVAVGLLALAACASQDGAPPDKSGNESPPPVPPGLGEVALTFSGTLPCAECAAERLVVTFFPDGSFRLWSRFQDEDGSDETVFHDLGRWKREPGQILRLDNAAGAARIFREQSRDTLIVLDSEADGTAEGPGPELARQPEVDPVAGPMALRGMYTYLADAAVLEECQTGRRFPVIIDRGHLELERAYLENRPGPGEPLLVSLEGQFEPRAPEPGAPEREHVRVLEFEEVWPGQSCAASPEPGQPPPG